MPFKIYADFECNVKRFRSSEKDDNTSYTENDQDHIPFIFRYTVLCVDDKFSKPQLLFTEEKIEFSDLLKKFLKGMITAKKAMNKHFNKNLVMSVEDEERFQSSNMRSICDKLFDVGDKVRDHCHTTET